MMSFYIIAPYDFTVKNILQQLRGIDWKLLGAKLDLNQTQVIIIEKENHYIYDDCLRKMVESWSYNNPSASWERLAAALEGISEKKRAQQVKELGKLFSECGKVVVGCVV